MNKQWLIIQASFFITSICIASDYTTSYDCDASNLTKVEKTICANYILSSKDYLMGMIYKSYSATKSGIFDEQKKWLKNRNECGDNSDCLENLYSLRIQNLVTEFKINDSENVSDPQMYTAVDASKGLSFFRMPECESLPDINSDGKAELRCIPNCGGPSCSWYFFASNQSGYKFFPELEHGSYFEVQVVKPDSIPEEIKSKVNKMGNWAVLKIPYFEIGSCTASEEFYIYNNGKYEKALSRSVKSKFKTCAENESL